MNQVRAQSQYNRRRDEKRLVSKQNLHVQIPVGQEVQKTDITIRMTSPINRKSSSRGELPRDEEVPKVEEEAIEKPNVIHVSMLLKNKPASMKYPGGTEGPSNMQETWIPLNVLQQRVSTGGWDQGTPGTAML